MVELIRKNYFGFFLGKIVLYMLVSLTAYVAKTCGSG